MIREFLAGKALLDLPIVAMLLFLLLFLGVLLRVASRARSESYRRMALLPLDDGDAAVRDGGSCGAANDIAGPSARGSDHDHR
jgi:hypothetical protein